MGTKVKVGTWQYGAAGCAEIRKDTEFAAKIFGDVVIYKIEIQADGQHLFMRLEPNDVDDKALKQE